jgi:hypothetical protein
MQLEVDIQNSEMNENTFRVILSRLMKYLFDVSRLSVVLKEGGKYLVFETEPGRHKSVIDRKVEIDQGRSLTSI